MRNGEKHPLFNGNIQRVRIDIKKIWIIKGFSCRWNLQKNLNRWIHKERKSTSQIFNYLDLHDAVSLWELGDRNITRLAMRHGGVFLKSISLIIKEYTQSLVEMTRFELSVFSTCFPKFSISVMSLYVSEIIEVWCSWLLVFEVLLVLLEADLGFPK